MDGSRRQRAAAAAKRDPSTGRFVTGHCDGPGRPTRETERGWLQKLRKKIPPDSKDWDEIIDKAIEQAKAGDRYARSWLSDFGLVERIERLEEAMREEREVRTFDRTRY